MIIEMVRYEASVPDKCDLFALISGWSEGVGSTYQTLKFARILRETGVVRVSLHGRHPEQYIRYQDPDFVGA
jgi:hypothetical protein